MYNMHLIINTHWDREYRWSFSETQFRLAEAVDDLINIMKNDPEFTYFHTDSQVSMLDDYLDIRPERAEELKRLVAEGRILTGPWYTLPAEFLVSGESLVRNLLMGHELSKRLGKVMKAGYNIFSWGQVSQLPQIYKQFGMDTIIFYRGIDQSKLDTLEFRWKSPDGTEVLGITFGSYHRLNFWRYVYLPYIFGVNSVSGDNHSIGRNNLGNAYLAHICDDNFDMVNHHVYNQSYARDLDAAEAGLYKLIDTVKDKSSVEDLLFLQGFDQENPDPIVTELVQRLNERINCGSIRVSNLEDYIATIKQKLVERGIDKKLPVFSGEMLEVERVGDAFGPLYNGVFSARMPIKLQNSKCEALLTGWAEPVAVWGMAMGNAYPSVSLSKAWKELLKNQQHDGIGGCHVDRVTETMNERFAQVCDIGETVVKSGLMELVGSVDCSSLQKNQIGLVVVNSRFKPRNEIVNCIVDIPKDWNIRWNGNNRRDISLQAKDSEGNIVPCQILSLDDNTVFGYLKYGNVIGFDTTRCHIALEAKDIPSNGYKLLTVTPQKFKQVAVNPISKNTLTMENSKLYVEIAENGTLRVTDKKTGRTFNRLHYFEDCSDKGGPLRFDPAYESGVITSLTQRPEIALVSNGELSATYRITYNWELPEQICTDLRIHVPHGSEWVDQGELKRSDKRKAITISTEVTLKKDSSQLEFKTVVENTVRDHRLRVVFPTGMKQAEMGLADSPFDLVEREIAVPDSTGWYEEAARTWPTKSLVSVKDSELRCSVFHCGLSEYEITDNDERSIALTLLRCFSTAGNPTETFRYQELAECQGKYTFMYAFDISPVSISDSELLNRAYDWTTPLHVVQTTAHAGVLPPEKSMVSLAEGSGFVVTCLKKAENSNEIVLRGYQESKLEEKVKITFGFSVKSAFKATLEELKIEEIPISDGSITFEAKPKEIVTIMLELGNSED